MTVRMTGGKASEFRGRGLASGTWMGGRVRGRLKGHGVVRSGVNLDGVGVNPGESESSIFYYSYRATLWGYFTHKFVGFDLVGVFLHCGGEKLTLTMPDYTYYDSHNAHTANTPTM